MNIETVNELIASLESAGELSIREQKFLKLAKAFKQLASENVALKSAVDHTIEWIESTNGDPCDVVILKGIRTPATDRIVAGIKADGVEEFAAYQRAITEEWACKEGHPSLLKVAESAELFAQQLREGADK
ncbi:hypothetical protein BLL03_05130 [Klebsiella pneumoniae]|uniref:hypothetical protein n=1 Tax=Klebsiella pneumoniae TaxID=573 RepID=UPI000B3EB0B8|nr:hypothetical protein [Klebsiella pneumoniae]OUY78112.1 hypothetical protein BLL03_05130 [Klebsiella pneumoniae]OUY84890.1 hypothetical protein BLL02_06640 [Klebsiella pneumoniae]